MVLLVAAGVAVGACGSSDSADTLPSIESTTTSTTTTSLSSSTADEPPAQTAPDDQNPETEPEPESGDPDKESADPAPPSRRTTIDDVDLVDPATPDHEFPRAAVPVDAYPAGEVLTEPSDAEVAAEVSALEADGHVVIPVVVETCTLVAVWALPHPGELVVGYEEHPDVDCIRSVPRTAVFTVPVAGENSEGEWNFAEPYDVTLQRRVG